jgi:uncharacterized membrane protein YdfJ with MMPL/SSD domain
MAGLLARIGRSTYRHRWVTLLAWLLILIAVASLSVAFSKPESTQFTVPGTQSQQAMDLLEQRFPAASGATAQMVFAAPTGATLNDPNIKSGVEASLAQTRRGTQVLLVTDPYSGQSISKDGRIGYATVAFKVPASNITAAAKNDLAAAARPARAQGVTVAFGGGIVNQPTTKSSDALGLLIAFMVLTITFGSMIAAGLPLLNALIGVGIGLTGINALSGIISLSATAPILATMLGLAVSIDYALFILHRYRDEIGTGASPEEAASTAAGTAGTAVVFAGCTVVVALAGLSVTGIPFLTIMGLCAAGTVLVAVLIAVTLIPALIGFAGSKIKPPREKQPGRGFFAVWVAFTTKRAVLIVVAGVILLLVIASPLLKLDLGLPSAGTLAKTDTARTAYDLLARGFGPGINGPLLVVVDAPARLNPVAVAETATKDLAAVPGVTSVSPPIQNATKDVTVVDVIPTSGPSSAATKDLVGTIREKSTAVAAPFGVRVLVTGPTALGIDVSAKLGAALPLYLLVVVGIAAILLMLVFRSLLVPLTAVLGFLLTIGATLGVVVWIFQDGHFANLVALPAAAPVISFLPLMMTGILFGLAMDYEMFLVSRMREEHRRGLAPVEAVRTGFGESGPVVTAAAIIMFSVFASYVMASDLITKEIAFALAVGVAVDAFIVRMTLIPAAMALLGRSAWWLPRWLDRILPRIDVEGAGLKPALEPAAAVSA